MIIWKALLGIMLMIDVSLIEKFEGFSSIPYICPAGKPTIGFGSTFYEDGTPVKMTDKPITKSELESLYVGIVKLKLNIQEINNC